MVNCDHTLSASASASSFVMAASSRRSTWGGKTAVSRNAHYNVSGRKEDPFRMPGERGLRHAIPHYQLGQHKRVLSGCVFLCPSPTVHSMLSSLSLVTLRFALQNPSSFSALVLCSFVV